MLEVRVVVLHSLDSFVHGHVGIQSEQLLALVEVIIQLILLLAGVGLLEGHAILQTLLDVKLDLVFERYLPDHGDLLLQLLFLLFRNCLLFPDDLGMW